MSFDKIKTIADLAAFIPLKKQELTSLKPEDSYRVFEVRKPGSDEMRTIETPTGKLKDILDRLADQFQWLYSDHKTDAAYGFVRAIATDPDKRNILTNAQKHLGLNYLLKVDFDNFFHQITNEKIRSLFNDYFLFPFAPDTEDLLNRLVTYKGRLPMGSPTSPVLSNFATIDLDHELLYWCRNREITYTRYVDDLSFSSSKPITQDHFTHLLSIMRSHRFEIDQQKTKWYGKKDIKEITGLIVGDTVSIPDAYIRDFEKSIAKLHEVCSCVHILPDHHVFDWIDKMKQVLRGQLNFVGAIHGKNHPWYLKLASLLNEADDVKPDEESISWRYIGYELH